MFSLLEFQGQSSLLHKSGTVEINTEYHTLRKPAWRVLLKLLGVAAMIAVGAAIALPTFLEFDFPLWQVVAITAGAMLIYMGISFFFRPEPNTDNLGFGGGKMNDPFQCSDNVNRFLWRLHCLLGPGRFTSETLLDTCALVGLVKGEEILDNKGHAEPRVGSFRSAAVGAFDATQPIAPLDPNRFAQSSANFVAGQIQLDSQRFFNSTSAAAESQAVKA